MKYRKLLSVLLALAMLLALLPAAALALRGGEGSGSSAENPYEPADWEDLNATLRGLKDNKMFYVRLTGDLYPTWASVAPVAQKYQEYWYEETDPDAYWAYYVEADTDGALTVIEGTSVTLDLNGHTLSGGLSETEAADHEKAIVTGFYEGIAVLGSLTVTDGSEGKAGVITGGNMTGIFIDETGDCTLAGGTVSDNEYGVLVEGGSFTMTGGAVSGNEFGVEVDYPYDEYGYREDDRPAGTFTMTGGTISGNGDDGVQVDDGVFTMKGGTISGNGDDGVDVCDGVFTMTGGTISDNGWAGVYMDGGTFTMSGGTISDNKWDGVIISDSVFAMSDGKISGNGHASLSETDSEGETGFYTMSGNGVLLCDGAKFTLSGGAICGNGAPDASRFNAEYFSRQLKEGETLSYTKFLPKDGYASTSVGVNVSDGCSFTMTDGTISDNGMCGVTICYGASEPEGASFAMSGGAICGNGATYYSPVADGEPAQALSGTGVYALSGAEVTLSGGRICDHNFYGIEIGGGTLTMRGGEVSGSSIGVLAEDHAAVEILGGRIAGNTAENLDADTSDQKLVTTLFGWAPAQFQASGVVFDAETAALTVSGGEITGNGRGIVAVRALSMLDMNYPASDDDGTEPAVGPVISGGEFSDNADADVLLVSSTPRLDLSEAEELADYREELADSMDEVDTGVFEPRETLTAPVIRVAGDLGEQVLKVGNVRLTTIIKRIGAALDGRTEYDEAEACARGIFTDGLPGHGGAANFLSAMEGYAVRLASNGEAAFLEADAALGLWPESLDLTVGETGKLVYILGTEVDPVSVAWSSADTRVARVSDSGVVTGVAGGSTKVSLTADFGNDIVYTVSGDVTVTALPGPTYIDPVDTGASGKAVNAAICINGKESTVNARVVGGVLAPDAAALLNRLNGVDSIESFEIDARAAGARSAVLPRAVARALAAKMAEDSKGVGLINADGALLLNAPAVRNLMTDAAGDVTLDFAKIEAADLNENQAKQLAGFKKLAGGDTEPGVLLSAGVTIGGEKAHEMGKNGKAMLLTDVPEPELAGAALRGAYLDPTAERIEPDAARTAELLKGGVFTLGEGRTLRFNAALYSPTCSEYVLYYETDDAAAVENCDHGDSCPLSAFTDVDPDEWYHDGIHYVLLKGWMQGLGDGTFDPGGTTTRAMAAQLLWNMEGKPDASAAIPFADVADDAWYAKAVRWAAENGVVEGWTDIESGKQVFAPDEYVTREQFAAMLYRYAKLHGQGFIGLWGYQLDYPDVDDVSDWAFEAMSWLVMKGVIKGIDGKLDPQGSSTRAQIATMVYRYDSIEE